MDIKFVGGGELSLPKDDYILAWRGKLHSIQGELLELSNHIEEKNILRFHNSNIERATSRISVAIAEIGTAINQLFLAEDKKGGEGDGIYQKESSGY